MPHVLEGLGDVEMRLLSAREIAQGLVDGSLHAGVTGEDLLHDLAPVGESDFEVVKRLGFGGADVIVAVPQAWVDVDTMSDLEAAGAAFRKAHHRRLKKREDDDQVGLKTREEEDEAEAEGLSRTMMERKWTRGD